MNRSRDRFAIFTTAADELWNELSIGRVGGGGEELNETNIMNVSVSDEKSPSTVIIIRDLPTLRSIISHREVSIHIIE